MEIRNEFSVGDRVVMAAAFLRSIGDYSRNTAMSQATVVEVFDGGRFVRVEFDGHEGEPIGVHSNNLWPADKLHLEPS